MAKLLESDFYYGAVLSMLINNGICPMLIEGGTDRQVYDFTTNDKDFTLFVKYRSKSRHTKTDGYLSWQFVFSDNDIEEIKNYLNSGKEFSIGLICGTEKLNKSQYAVLKRENIEELIKLKKTSVTLSIMTGEHAFRISIGGGRKKSLKIKTNEIY